MTRDEHREPAARFRPTVRAAALLAIAALAAAVRVAGAGASPDERLLDAVTDGSERRVRALLDEGADPNAVLGSLREEKALCVASARDNGRVLDLMLAAGADADVLYERRDILSANPLGCAISYENLDAVKTLVKAGADPMRDLCPSCPTDFATRIIAQASSPRTYDIAWYLINTTTLTEGEIRAVAHSISKFPIPKHDPTLDERALIVDWLRARGVEVEPTEPF